MGIAVYAELLSNLRQLSVVANLPSPSDSTTSASISEDGSSLTVHHRGESQLLLLPAAPNRSTLGVPAQASTALTWRLRLPPSDVPPTRFALEDQDTPWNARDLRIGSPVKCRACGKCLVSDSSILEWKDLPSDNWAEMMEFWHCHKPVDHSEKPAEADGDPTATKKGYGANNVITAQQGVGLVDVTSLVFSTADCKAIVYSTGDLDLENDISELKLEDMGSTRFNYVSCKACDAQVGVFNVATRAVSLFKWRVDCDTKSTAPAPELSHCLAATLMATISRSGSAKCIIAPHLIGIARAEAPPGSQSLYVWVLNSNVVYSASQSLKSRRGPAMKILFRPVAVKEGNEIVDAMNSDVQELTLPVVAIDAVIDSLRESNHFLPVKEKSFQEWEVGLLHRWESRNNRDINT